MRWAKREKFVVQWGGQDGAHRVGKTARARRLRELALAARMYQPDEVRSDRCQALLWNGGKGKRQCGNKPVSGGDLCAKHKKENAAHGRVRGPIPAQKFELFVKHALKSESKEKPSKQWYARHLIWFYASELVPAVE